METEAKTDSPKGLDEFTEWMESFCDTNHVPGCIYKEEYTDLLELEESEILSLTSDECFTKSLILMNYATFLMKRLGIIKAQLHWCKETMDFLIGKYWESYGSSTPWDIRRKVIIKDNSYMTLLQKYIIQLESTVVIMENSYYDIKKRATIFENLGKKRGFE